MKPGRSLQRDVIREIECTKATDYYCIQKRREMAVRIFSDEVYQPLKELSREELMDLVLCLLDRDPPCPVDLSLLNRKIKHVLLFRDTKQDDEPCDESDQTQCIVCQAMKQAKSTDEYLQVLQELRITTNGEQS